VKPGLFSCFRADLYFGCLLALRSRVLALSPEPPLRFFAGCEPEAFAVHLQDVDMMRVSVEERAGKPFRAEDRNPFIEWPGSK